jgi:hypothetical protein
MNDFAMKGLFIEMANLFSITVFHLIFSIKMFMGLYIIYFVPLSKTNGIGHLSFLYGIVSTSE